MVHTTRISTFCVSKGLLSKLLFLVVYHGFGGEQRESGGRSCFDPRLGLVEKLGSGKETTSLDRSSREQHKHRFVPPLLSIPSNFPSRSLLKHRRSEKKAKNHSKVAHQSLTLCS